MSDSSIVDIMQKGFLDGALDESKDKIKKEQEAGLDVILNTDEIGVDKSVEEEIASLEEEIKKHEQAIASGPAVFPSPTDPSVSPSPSSPAVLPEPKKRRKFYEGEINWKFTDVNTNNDCWTDWNYVTKEGKEIEVKRTYLRTDGRTFCAVDKATPEAYRREKDPEPTFMDQIDDMTGNKWGLAGAIGLGLTEELVRVAIKKSAEAAVKRAAKKAAEEASEALLRSAGKEVNKKIEQKISKKAGQLASDSGKKLLEASKKARKELSEKINEAVVSKFNSKTAAKLRNKLSGEMKREFMEKYGKQSMKAIKDNMIKRITSTITSKNLKISVEAVQNLITQRVSTMTFKLAKTASSVLESQIIKKVTAEVQHLISAKLYKAILSRVTTSITEYMAKKLAKAILLKAVIKAKAIAAVVAFFRSQAKLFMSIGKSIANSGDNAAKLAAKLLALSRTLGRQSIKNGFKTGLKAAAKLASKLKPGPLTVFDILSTALDVADPMGYNAFLNTKDYKKAIEESNTSRKQYFIDELLKSDTFKDSGLTAADIEYPIKLDPTSDLPVEDEQNMITDKINFLFKLANVSTPPLAIASFVNKLNSDLMSGILLETDLDNDDKLKIYIDMIDMDAITLMVKKDMCFKQGGILYDKDKCTYSKANCDKLYTWPLDSEKRPNDIYAEFKDGICVQGNPEARVICESMKATWNKETNSCNLDKTYCTLNGGEMDSNGECSIPVSQEIIEYIFGTTVTRVGKLYVDTTVSAVNKLLDTFLENCGYDGEFKTHGKCIDGGGNLASGNKLKIWDCNKSRAQKWYYSSGDNTIRPQDDYNKCVDIPGGNAVSGNSLQLWDCNGTIAQKFMYSEDTKQIIALKNKGLCFELDEDRTSNGTTFNLKTCRDHPSQKFDLTRNDIVNTGATCSVTTSRVADCPEGYTNNGLTCGRGDRTAFWDSGRPADCPPGYTNNGLTCGRGVESNTLDFGSGKYIVADCPRTYTNWGATCYRDGLTSFMRDHFSRLFSSIESDKARCEDKYGAGNCEIRGIPGSRVALPYCDVEAKYINRANADLYTEDGLGTIGSRCGLWASSISSDKMTCPEGKYNKLNTTLGLCYIDCEKEYGPGFYNNGTSCWRDVDTLGVGSMTCKSDEIKTGARCYKKCADVYGDDYFHDGTRCYSPVSTLGTDKMTCGPGEKFVAGRCYPKPFSNDFTDLGLTQSRTRQKKNPVGFLDIGNQVKNLKAKLAGTY